VSDLPLKAASAVDSDDFAAAPPFAVLVWMGSSRDAQVRATRADT
jgi:hypothetical protein